MEYFLYKGFIYVFKSDLNKLIETVFRENVVRRLNLMNKHYDSICADKRISDIIKRLLMRRESIFNIKLKKNHFFGKKFKNIFSGKRKKNI